MSTQPQQDAIVSMEQMAIAEKYEDFLNYIYPILIGISRGHIVLRGQGMRSGQIHIICYGN